MLRLLRVSFAFGWFKRDEQYLLPRLREILQVEPQAASNLMSTKGSEGSVLSPRDHSLLMVPPKYPLPLMFSKSNMKHVLYLIYI
jgi:hypothetical protein